MMSSTPTTKRAAIICRVSTDQQDTLRQVEQLTEYAQRKGFSVNPDDIFEDKVSGYSKQESRPQLQRFYSFVDDGVKFDGVFFTESTRIARKPIEGHKILDKICEDFKIPVYVAQQDLCSITERGDRNPMFFIMMAMLLEFADHEAKSFKQRSKTGMKTRAKLGYAPGGAFLNYGFKKDLDKKFVVDEEEAEVVRRIYDLALEGLGGKRIAGILNYEKVRTRVNKSLSGKTIKTRGGRVVPADKVIWSDGTIQEILTNPIYMGKRKFMDLTIDVPPIVSPEIWKEVKRIRSERGDKRVKETKYHFILKGLAKCGRCGRNYVGRFKVDGKEEYYQCSSTREKEGSCGNRALSISRFDGAVWHMVKQSKYVQDFLAENNDSESKLLKQLATLEAELKVQDGVLKAAMSELANLRKMRMKDQVDDAFFDAEKPKLDGIIRTAEAHTEKLTLAISSVKHNITSLKGMDNIMAMIEQASNDPFQIRKILVKIISKIVITSETSEVNCSKYVISIFIKGVDDPYSFVYNKKTNTILYQPVIATFHRLNSLASAFYGINGHISEIQVLDGTTATSYTLTDNETEMTPAEYEWALYNEHGILQNDVQEIISSHEKYMNDSVFSPFIWVPIPILFQRLNTLKLATVV